MEDTQESAAARQEREMVALRAFEEKAAHWFKACEAYSQAKIALSDAENAKVKAEEQRNKDIREAFREGVTPDVIGYVLTLSRTMVYRILGG
jgi:flagellar biosynthesis/type III secretory pathway protein FliH